LCRKVFSLGHSLYTLRVAKIHIPSAKDFYSDIYSHSWCWIVKSTFWPYSKDPYEIFELLIEDPRMTKLQMARRFKVNPNTLVTWWNSAIDNRIILLPIFRRKSFKNFREFFYFLKTEDPHKLFEVLQIQDLPISYFSVQTGFCNFQIVAKEPIEPRGEVALSGERSDYFVTVPPKREFRESVRRIDAMLRNLDVLKPRKSPLKYRDEEYTPWDEKDEAIYWEICNNLRIPFASVVQSAKTYNDKAWAWFRNREEFGDTMTFFFPRGESAYIPSLYVIDTNHDSLLIDIFSQLPATTVFYRIGGKVLMLAYLPFTSEGRSIVRKTLSILEKEELVTGYTNSIIEYHYRF